MRLGRLLALGAFLAVLVGACTGGHGAEPDSSRRGLRAAEARTIYGFWDLVELDGKRPAREPSLAFTLQPSFNSPEALPRYLSFSGFDGCNGISGDFLVVGNHLETGNVASTAMGCGAVLRDQADQILGALNDAVWEVAGGQLIVRGESGNVAVLEPMKTERAVGVYALAEVDGRPVEAGASLTVLAEGSYNGYAGCSILGTYELDGDRLVMTGARSVASVTTTMPPPPATIDRADVEPVSPLRGCGAVTDQERQVLTLLTSGDGVLDKDGFTISNDAGATASFRRP